MNKFDSLFIVTLLLVSSSAWADRSADLRYCLSIKSNHEIAKCAGEISPVKRGRPYTREEVEKILDKEKTTEPVRANESPGMPATTDDHKDALPGKTENN